MFDEHVDILRLRFMYNFIVFYEQTYVNFSSEDILFVNVCLFTNKLCMFLLTIINVVRESKHSLIISW